MESGSGASGGRPDRTEADEESSARATGLGRLVPGPVRRSYALKFTVSFIVVLLLIAGLGGLSYFQIQTIIEDDAENTLRSTAILQADSVGEWVAGMRTQTNALAAADVYAGGDRTRIRRYLADSTRYVDRDVAGVHYVDPETETVIASTNADVEGRQVTSITPGWLGPIRAVADQGPNNTTVAVSDSVYERNGRLYMAFATRARDADGVVVVVGDVQRDFEKLHETRSIVTTRVLNDRGYDVFTSRHSGVNPLSRTAGFRSAMDGETVVYEPEGGRSVLALSPVANADWVVVTRAPKSELYRASQTVGRNVLLLIGTSVVVLSVVGIVLGRQTILPLVQLRRLTREIERGNLDVDFASDRADEIGRLFDSFGNMRDALRDQIREANQARARAERSRRELERQNDRLDQFASTVSHDLRNPLTVAQGNLDLALEDLEDDSFDREGVAERLRDVDDAHGRIHSIIDDVLALAREGETIEETETVDLAAVAEDAWSNVDSKAATLAVEDGIAFEADRTRLLRAMENLFRNAVDHVGPDVAVEVGATETGFYVADDGPGIAEDAVEDVFEFGYSADDEGTGLGLAIVDTIASAHGWTVRVDADYEDGARFVFDDVGDRP